MTTLRNTHKTFADVSAANSGAAVGGIIGMGAGVAFVFNAPLAAILPDLPTAIGGGAVIGILFGAVVGMVIDVQKTRDNRSALVHRRS